MVIDNTRGELPTQNIKISNTVLCLHSGVVNGGAGRVYKRGQGKNSFLYLYLVVDIY